MKYKIFPVKIFYFEHCPPFTCAFIPHAISARSQVVGGRKWKIIGGGKWNHIRRGRFQWKGVGTSLVKTGALLDLVLWSCFLVSKLLGVPFWWCTIGTSGPLCNPHPLASRCFGSKKPSAERSGPPCLPPSIWHILRDVEGVSALKDVEGVSAVKMRDACSTINIGNVSHTDFSAPNTCYLV